MAFRFGFYNSIDHDRVYDADQFGDMFSGLITDGIYSTIGDAFAVKPAADMGVTVGTGRCWFNKTWSVNTSVMSLAIEPADLLLPRIDAVVIEIDKRTVVRANSIKAITGIPAVKPEKPTLTNTDEVHQYPLAYISIAQNQETIKASDIEIMVGQAPCPMVTGVLESVDITPFWDQWRAQFTEWFDEIKTTLSDDAAGSLLVQVQDRVRYDDKATEEEAKDGVRDDVWMTPKLVKDAINFTDPGSIGINSSGIPIGTVLNGQEVPEIYRNKTRCDYGFKMSTPLVRYGHNSITNANTFFSCLNQCMGFSTNDINGMNRKFPLANGETFTIINDSQISTSKGTLNIPGVSLVRTELCGYTVHDSGYTTVVFRRNTNQLDLVFVYNEYIIEHVVATVVQATNSLLIGDKLVCFANTSNNDKNVYMYDVTRSGVSNKRIIGEYDGNFTTNELNGFNNGLTYSDEVANYGYFINYNKTGIIIIDGTNEQVLTYPIGLHQTVVPTQYGPYILEYEISDYRTEAAFNYQTYVSDYYTTSHAYGFTRFSRIVIKTYIKQLLNNLPIIIDGNPAFILPKDNSLPPAETPSSSSNRTYYLGSFIANHQSFDGITNGNLDKICSIGNDPVISTINDFKTGSTTSDVSTYLKRCNWSLGFSVPPVLLQYSGMSQMYVAIFTQNNQILTADGFYGSEVRKYPSKVIPIYPDSKNIGLYLQSS